MMIFFCLRLLAEKRQTQLVTRAAVQRSVNCAAVKINSWNVDLGISFSAILSGNETLVSLSTDGVVSLVSLKDFTVRHKFCVGDKTFSSSPVVWNGHLVLGSRNNFIDCFEFV